MKSPRLLSILLLLKLAGCIQHAAASQAPHNLSKGWENYETCRGMKSLNQSMIAQLRNMHQLMAQHMQKRGEVRMFIKFAEEPSDDPRDIAAYGSNRTAGRLRADETHYTNSIKELEARIMELMGELQAEGAMTDEMSKRDLHHCFYGRLSPHLYPDPRPEISIMLQYFNRPWQVPKVLEPLLECSAEVDLEILVNVDSLSEMDMWAKYVRSSEGRVVPLLSDNVHEARAYNRLANLAKAPLVMVWQDDQIPLNCSWLHDVLALFQRFPDMGAMGHNGYCFYLDKACTGGITAFELPDTGVHFQFVELADYAPMTFRRSAWLDIGGIDEGMMGKGECAIWSDYDISMRLWLAGYQIGYYPFSRGSDSVEEQGGTHRNATSKKCWEKQKLLSSGLFRFRYERTVDRYQVHDEIFSQVKALNLNLTLRGDTGWCPYRWPTLCQGLPYKEHPDAKELADRGSDDWLPLSSYDLVLRRHSRRLRGEGGSSSRGSRRALGRRGHGGDAAQHAAEQEGR